MITLQGTYTTEDNSRKKDLILRIKKKEFEIWNEEKTTQNYNELLKNLIQEIENTSNIVFNNNIYYKFILKSTDNLLKIDYHGIGVPKVNNSK